VSRPRCREGTKTCLARRLACVKTSSRVLGVERRKERRIDVLVDSPPSAYRSPTSSLFPEGVRSAVDLRQRKPSPCLAQRRLPTNLVRSGTRVGRGRSAHAELLSRILGVEKAISTYGRYIRVSFVWPSSLVQFGSLVKEVVNQDGHKKGVASIVLSTTEHGDKAKGETHSPSLAHELFNQRRHWPINSEALLWTS
jgi:hypothetical protein